MSPGDSQHGSLGSHLEKFQGICFEYEESVTWTGAMVPVLQPGGSGLETAEERCHLARVLIFSQLSTGKGVQSSALDPAGGGACRASAKGFPLGGQPATRLREVPGNESVAVQLLYPVLYLHLHGHNNTTYNS